jgi:hypothetical protein
MIGYESPDGNDRIYTTAKHCQVSLCQENENLCKIDLFLLDRQDFPHNPEDTMAETLCRLFLPFENVRLKDLHRFPKGSQLDR